MSSDAARNLISTGLEVDADSDADGTLASEETLALINSIDPDLGLLEILASLSSAAIGAADIHEDMVNDPTSGQIDPDMADTVARLKRFAACIDAARREIR